MVGLNEVKLQSIFYRKAIWECHHKAKVPPDTFENYVG